MRRRFVPIALVLLALLAGACRGDDNGNALSEATLQGYLLTQADVPAGFTLSEEEEEEEEEEDDSSCFGSNTGSIDPSSSTSADFSDADTGRQITHELEAYEAGKGTEAMAEGRAMLERCRTFEEPLEGQTMRGSLTEATFPTLGDESAAFALTAEIAGVTVNAEIVAVRRGDVLAIVSMLVPNGPVDRAAFEAVVRKAADKLPA